MLVDYGLADYYPQTARRIRPVLLTPIDGPYVPKAAQVCARGTFAAVTRHQRCRDRHSKQRVSILVSSGTTVACKFLLRLALGQGGHGQ